MKKVKGHTRGRIENIGWVEDNLLPPLLGGGKKSNNRLPKLRIISKKNNDINIH